METVNNILIEDKQKRFNCPPQPLPQYSEYAKKKVLPSLNGLGSKSFSKLVKPPLRITSMRRTSVFDKLTIFGFSETFSRKIGQIAFKLLPWWADKLTFSLVLVLEKSETVEEKHDHFGLECEDSTLNSVGPD